jgi:hypothetical protein
VASDNVGDLNLLALSVGGDQKRLGAALQNAPVPLKMAPPVKDPTAAAVPLKSNVMTYGPWGAAGAPGKVRSSTTGTLTPWGYGTYEAMNQAAGAKVAAAVTSQQVFETGAAEVVGAPAAGLGDVLHQAARTSPTSTSRSARRG